MYATLCGWTTLVVGFWHDLLLRNGRQQMFI